MKILCHLAYDTLDHIFMIFFIYRRYQIIIDLIKAVRKKEVRKLGKPSAARRPLQFEEFSNTIAILHTYPDSIHRYEMSALCAFKFHMVGRIDDCVQLKKENLKPNDRFPVSKRISR